MRILQSGGTPATQVYGVELDAKTHAQTAGKIVPEFSLPTRNLILSDFFDLYPETIAPMDAVVGNPPFIRYQRFFGTYRAKAMACARKEGVSLSSLSSSWAPFLVHSIAMLRQGGRLAMVLPVEIGHASYARPLLAYLSRSFAKATFLTFRRKLFPNLSEDTLLLLAEGRGEGPATFFWRDVLDASRLGELLAHNDYCVGGLRRLNTGAIAQGAERISDCFLPRKALGLYRALAEHAGTMRLGQLADVGIGYVTGANDFFHLPAQEVSRWRIPTRYLRPAVRRSRAFSGLRFTETDWRRTLATGDSGFLLLIESDSRLPESLLAYLRQGEGQGVPSAFKCRVRSPWYRVPHVYLPDAFLTYMSGVTPRLVANDAGVVAPNSLHILRLYPQCGLRGDGLAALWQTSLTLLSAEIEGHALGGGMLKLEPTEAQRVLLAVATGGDDKLAQLTQELDLLIRSGLNEEARRRADAEILKQGLGLSEADCLILRAAANRLRVRRYSRSKST
jgi:hypothetical protein